MVSLIYCTRIVPKFASIQIYVLFEKNFSSSEQKGAEVDSKYTNQKSTIRILNHARKTGKVFDPYL